MLYLAFPFCSFFHVKYQILAFKKQLLQDVDVWA